MLQKLQGRWKNWVCPGICSLCHHTSSCVQCHQASLEVLGAGGGRQRWAGQWLLGWRRGNQVHSHPWAEPAPEEAGEHGPAFPTANTNTPVHRETGEAASLNPERRRGHAERSGEHRGTQPLPRRAGPGAGGRSCDAICFLCNAVAGGQLRLACQDPRSWGQSGAEGRGRTTHWHCLG